MARKRIRRGPTSGPRRKPPKRDRRPKGHKPKRDRRKSRNRGRLY